MINLRKDMEGLFLQIVRAFHLEVMLKSQIIIFFFGHTPKVCVKLRNLDNELEYVWQRDKFVRRKYLMQEMYQNFVEGSDWKLPDVSTMSLHLTISDVLSIKDIRLGRLNNFCLIPT